MKNSPLLITLVAYSFVVFFIAYIAKRSTKNLSDYVLAGRHLSGPIAALGAGASDMSAWLLMALPGAVFVSGLREVWLPIGLAIGAYLNWRFVAKRLRVYTEIARDALTIPAFFENRFYANGHLLRAVAALVILLFFTIYTAAGFVATGLLTHTAFGLDYQTSLWLSAVFIVAYTCLGGFLAVSWIDFFQGSLMFFALIICPYLIFSHLGGVQSTFQQIAAQGRGYLNVFQQTRWIDFFSMLAFGLGYFGQPHILVRFMAIDHERSIRSAQRICMSWMVVSLVGAVCVGLGGIVFFVGKPLANPETAFLSLAQQLFNPWVTGLLLSAVLSASMSTVAAQLLASSSAIVEDCYHLFFRPTASARELLLVSRITVLFIAVIAVLIAMNPKNSILFLVQYAWSGIGASFGPVILFCLYWPKTTQRGVVSGLLVGALTVVVWHGLRHFFGGVFVLNEILPGFILNCITIVLVSLGGVPSSFALTQFIQVEARVNHE